MVEAALLYYAEKQWGEPWIGEYYNYHSNVPGTVFDIPGLGDVTLVAFNEPKDMSYAEHSEEVWLVFEVQGSLYKKTGTHTSYTGTDWHEGLKIVVPKLRTVIDYEES